MLNKRPRPTDHAFDTAHPTHIFNQLIGSLETMMGQASAANQNSFEWDGARLELTPLKWGDGTPAVLFIFTLTDFKVTDADTLAHLLSLNRTLLKECELPACFTLDDSGQHVQFQQRMRLESLPEGLVRRYIQDSLDSLRTLFALPVV